MNADECEFACISVHRRFPFPRPPFSPIHNPFHLSNASGPRSKLTLIDKSVTRVLAGISDSAGERKIIRLVRYVFDLRPFLPPVVASGWWLVTSD
jgi:hypothetical protein